MGQTITLPEPRSVTRLAYQMAINAATTDGARIELLSALQWYELRWQATDRQRASTNGQAVEGVKTPPE